MVNIDDFVTLIPRDKTQADAIDYAGRSINYTFNRMDYHHLESRLIRIVVGITIEKAFETYLSTRGMVLNLSGRTHWRVRDKAEFVIGNLRIDIKGYHVYPAKNRQFPEWFLDTEGLVPVDQFDRANSADAYCQAFLIAPQYNGTNTHRYVAVFPPELRISDRWAKASRIDISWSSGTPSENQITICGEGPEVIGQPETMYGDATEQVTLSPISVSYKTIKRFGSLQYLWTSKRPTSSISLRTERGQTHEVKPNDWHDLWLANPRVYFTAWGTKDDYRTGQYISKGTSTKVYTNGTRTANYSALIRNLRPMSELLKL